MENYEIAHRSQPRCFMGEIPWTELCDNSFPLKHYPRAQSKQCIPYCYPETLKAGFFGNSEKWNCVLSWLIGKYCELNDVDRHVSSGQAELNDVDGHVCSGQTELMLTDMYLLVKLSWMMLTDMYVVVKLNWMMLTDMYLLVKLSWMMLTDMYLVVGLRW